MKTLLPDSLFKKETGKFFLKAIAPLSFNRRQPSVFIKQLAKTFKEAAPREQRRRVLVGGVFEYGLAECLARKEIFPFYVQVRLSFVPNAKFDILLYHPTKPVVISAMISVANRWKLAAYEGLLLKSVYPTAKNYLVTTDARNTNARNKDIEQGKAPGIDKCIDASCADWNTLLDRLQQRANSNDPFQLIKAVNPLANRAICYDGS